VIILGLGWDGGSRRVLRRRTGSYLDLLSLKCFLHRDALVLSLPFGFFALDDLVLSEVFDILRVIVSVIRLSFRCRVE
jgi:hypothetical protein